jgi:GNAT superfamily N-acetyltransferase
MTEIRSATSADAGPLAELRWEFRTSRLPPQETHDAFLKRCAPWMRRELTNAHSWRAWVAVSNKAIVGQVWLNTVHKIPNPVAELETHGYLSNLYVKPSERGGTGTRLLDAALKWAQSNGIDRVVLWPSPRSVTLYLRHGFSHGGEVMELKVSKPR